MANSILDEGFITVEGHRIWYGVAGTGERDGKWPVLVVHGGPGLPHDYLEGMAELADDGRRVVFYDQLGCGNSDRPNDPSVWSTDWFIRELAAVRAALGLRRVHIYGHSYGGVVALNYALSQPSEPASLILANSFHRTGAFLESWDRWLRSMPDDVARALREYQDTGRSSAPDPAGLFQTYFVRRHVCRVPPPPGLARAQGKFGAEVYEAMHGPRWFKVTGHYKDWDASDRLGEVRLPTLVVSGRHDQVRPEVAQEIQAGIPGARLHVFEEASHLPFIEIPTQHRQVVSGFLDVVEG